jgi:hypothetical protein
MPRRNVETLASGKTITYGERANRGSSRNPMGVDSDAGA